MIQKNQLKKIQELKKFIVHKYKSYRLLPELYKSIIGGLFLCLITIVSLVSYEHHRYSKTLSAFKPKANFSNSEKLTPKAALEQLNQQTPLELVFNEQVQHYIKLYQTERKDQLEIFWQRSQIYFPIIESTLDKYELPLELKYLAVVESGLNPLAVSKSGAVGLWQFLYNTCNLLDLEVNSYIDERRDVYISTEAACKYLEYLHRIFNDWNLAMAAYNSGPGEVKKAIARSGGLHDYWKIREFLPKQAANYVPAFIAFNYLFYEADKDQLKDTVNVKFRYLDLDTIWLNKAETFKEISAITGISIDDISYLNPVYKTSFIPKFEQKPTLVLPEVAIIKYLNHFVNDAKTGATITNSHAKEKTEVRDSCIVHIVKTGEFFHKIALNYNCTIEDIQKWNKNDSMSLFPGQQLTIWIESEKR